MEVNEQEARDTLTAAGFASAKKCSQDALVRKLNGLGKVLDELQEPEDETQKTLFKSLVEANENHDEITLEGMEDMSEEHEDNGEEKTPKKRGRKPGSGKAKAATEKKDKSPTDRYGSRLGSDCAKVNEILSGDPKSEPDLRREAGVKSSVEYHLDRMVRLGTLKWKRDVGYFLPAKAK